jgi:hypothetical protein
MTPTVTVSLSLNLAVLAPVMWGLVRDAPWAQQSYGPKSAARGILLAIYVAIFAASAGLLVRPSSGAIAALLAVQVFYKLLSPITVGTLRNPVVLSNLAIALVHAITLAALASSEVEAHSAR